MNLGVLMVTGVYHPEVSGAANQCRNLMSSLSRNISFMVLTTTQDTDLTSRSQVDGIEVFRVLLEKGVSNYCRAIWKFTSFFSSRRKDFQIVHLHGFTTKSILLVFLSKLFNKKIIIKMTSINHDDPHTMKKRGLLLYHFYSKANVYVGTNQQFKNIFQKKSYFPRERFSLIPNGVDTERFFPSSNGEKRRLRQQLKLPQKLKIILFVGHFSKEKCPDVLINAWKEYVADACPESAVIFIGTTNPDHYEVDVDLVKEVKRLAKPLQYKRVFFIEKTHNIEKYYQASDIFVMPSLREGLPNAMLEAMSCELPVIVSQLEGMTDWVVEDGVNSLLISPGSGIELSEKIIHLLNNADLSIAIGKEARKTILKRFTIEDTAKQYNILYTSMG